MFSCTVNNASLDVVTMQEMFVDKTTRNYAHIHFYITKTLSMCMGNMLWTYSGRAIFIMNLVVNMYRYVPFFCLHVVLQPSSIYVYALISRTNTIIVYGILYE